MPHPVTHFEIVHKDAKQLQSFYSDIFGWKIDANNPMEYGTVDTGEGIGGGIGQAPESYAGHITFYIQVEDPKATLEQIEKAGGKTMMPPDDVPGGRRSLNSRIPRGTWWG